MYIPAAISSSKQLMEEVVREILLQGSMVFSPRQRSQKVPAVRHGMLCLFALDLYLSVARSCGVGQRFSMETWEFAQRISLGLCCSLLSVDAPNAHLESLVGEQCVRTTLEVWLRGSSIDENDSNSENDSSKCDLQATALGRIWAMLEEHIRESGYHPAECGRRDRARYLGRIRRC